MIVGAHSRMGEAVDESPATQGRIWQMRSTKKGWPTIGQPALEF
jgi:hypothetical protein